MMQIREPASKLLQIIYMHRMLGLHLDHFRFLTEGRKAKKNKSPEELRLCAQQRSCDLVSFLGISAAKPPALGGFWSVFPLRTGFTCFKALISTNEEHLILLCTIRIIMEMLVPPKPVIKMVNMKGNHVRAEESP